jgi:hypothetical protein
VVTYFSFVAQQVREILASLGARSLDEIIGRADLLTRVERPEVPRAQMVDLSALMAPAESDTTPRLHQITRNDRPGVVYLDDSLDFERPLDSSILLHELVHYVQHDRDGPATTCAEWLRREQQAYRIQIEALIRVGADTLAPVMAVRSLTCS